MPLAFPLRNILDVEQPNLKWRENRSGSQLEGEIAPERKSKI
jgi:hypothetical protein